VQSGKNRNYLTTFKATDCALGMGVFTLGLGLNLYTAGEVVAAVMVSSIVVLTLGLTLTGILLILYAAKSVASWRRVASRNSTLLTCLTAELARPRVTE
jgi:membrane protein implicated in regulation of membrane protease activity